MVQRISVLFAGVATTLLSALAASAVPSPSHFQLLSDNFVDNARLPMDQVYTAAGGGNESPELHWSGAPFGTKSYILTVYDPDARHGWWHWLQQSIPSNLSELRAGAGDVSKTVLGATVHFNDMTGNPAIRNSFGDMGYDGPYPPIGDPPHHYVFNLYALNVKSLPINESSTMDEIKNAIFAHKIGQAKLVGMFGRAVPN